QLLGDERRVPWVIWVLVEAIFRVGERHDHRRDLKGVDEVVKNSLHPRVVEVVAAVVDDQQRVAARAAVAGGQVEGDVSCVTQRRVRELKVLKLPWPRLRVGLN